METRKLGFPEADEGAIPVRQLLVVRRGADKSETHQFFVEGSVNKRPIPGNTECVNQVWQGPRREGTFGRWQSIQAPKQNFYLTTTSKSLIIHNISGRV